MVKQGKSSSRYQKALEAAVKARTQFLKDENKASDEKIVADVTMMFYKDIDKEQHPIDFYRTQVEAWGKLNDEATYKKYANMYLKRQ